ncbi:MAG: type II toxin-antitoxin system VapC family toxin [Candidatus Nanohaloarchaea archaeon]
MKTVVDTNVLISLLNSEDSNNEESEQLLGKLNREGSLFINPVVYSELAVYFDSRKKLENFLNDTGLKIEALNRQACFTAGEKFSEYLNNRSNDFQCPECGEKNRVECGNCGENLNRRQHIASDFLIGSHAQEQADRLASFDTGFHKEYFKELKTVPET